MTMQPSRFARWNDCARSVFFFFCRRNLLLLLTLLLMGGIDYFLV